MKKCLSVFWLLALELHLIGVGLHSASAATPASDRVVVMISVDGLANFYMGDQAAAMPTIRQLASDGAKAAGMRASDPSVTWPNHTTLVTGVSPARHGVVGNNYYDRITGKMVQLIGDPVLDKDAIVKVPTIYDMAKAAGLKTAAVLWPATRNARSLDWTTPDVNKHELVLKYTTPSLLDECKEAGIEFAQADLPQDRNTRDLVLTQLFNHILRKHRPNLAILHLAQVDYVEHGFGPQSAEAYAAIKAADAQVREVWDVLQQEFPGKATIIVVSDHGFSPLEKRLSTNVVLKQAGLIEVVGDRVTGGSVHVVPQGGSALVYVGDDVNRAATIDQVKNAFANVEGVAKIVGVDGFAEYGIADPKNDPNAPDLMIFAKLGYYFGDTAAGTLPVSDKPERKGGHGHDSHLPELQAVFIACGAGIKPGTELGAIDNLSVAPTIASLLGIELPNAEGKPLTEALE